jgi:hypothetical protein
LFIGKTACGRFSDIGFAGGRTTSPGSILNGVIRPEGKAQGRHSAPTQQVGCS